MDPYVQSLDSSPHRRRDLTQSENDSQSSHVPRQQPIPSASRLPSSSYPHPASAKYIGQFRALLEHQRQVHSEERELWHLERKDLEEKITKLDASLQRYQAMSSSQAMSPVEKSVSNVNSSLWSPLSSQGTRHKSTSGTGDEVWRGPKTDVQPTRTFSEDLTGSVKPGDRLPSIGQNSLISSKRRRESSDQSTDKHGAPHKPSIGVAEIDKNLDGITFKASGIPPGLVKKVMTPQSPSPLQDSPSKVSPGTLAMPSSKLEVPEEVLTRDAGHTPLARQSYLNNDGPSSTGSADASTPTHPELERPPLEPHTTGVRLPSERSDSYFPPVPEEPEPSGDEDPELQGPLGLTNDISKDSKFLDVLDSKLMQAAKSNDLDSPAVAGASNKGSLEGGDGVPEFEQPDHEPGLKMKRSMNFGSAFGSKSCGRGI